MKPLIDSLLNKGIINDQEVYNVMFGIDRAEFVQDSPYFDSPQYIGYGATISAPHMHAYALVNLF
jgi:protein-L-isoaspartate(D-aspartate) O-methyltransferase